MGFIELELLILITIVLSGLLKGKRYVVILSIIWIGISLVMFIMNKFIGLLLITICIDFQIGLMASDVREYIFEDEKIKKIFSMNKKRHNG